MDGSVVSCTQTYLSTHRVAVGTTAVIHEFGADTVRLAITKPAKGTELAPGETFDVPRSEFFTFWQRVETS